MKKLHALLLLLLISTAASSQTYYYWIGAGPDDNWTTGQNWSLTFNGTPNAAADFPNGFNDIAIFGYDIVTNPSAPHDPCDPVLNKNCVIDQNTVGGTGATQVGGIHVNAYSGVITQSNNNRFLVAETPGAGGDWSGLLINRAVFNFGTCGVTTGKFVGSQYTGLLAPAYAINFSTPLEILNGEFHGSLQSTQIRYGAIITPGTFFHENGVVHLNNRSVSSPIPTQFYQFSGTVFYELWVGGANNTAQNFSGTYCYVDNLFRTLTGNVVELENGIIGVRGNVQIDNTFTASITGFLTPGYFGDAIVRMEGTLGPQYMYNSSGYWLTGPLPRIEIANSAGVYINGPVTAYDEIIFTNGIVYPDPLGTGNLLSLHNPSATTVGMSDASHAEIPFRFRGHFNFEAPVGAGGQARPMIFNFTSNSVYNVYTVEYFNGASSAPAIVGTAMDPSLLNVSTCEYWKVERNMNPNSSATIGMRVQLGYDATSCTFTNPPAVGDCERVVTSWSYASNEWENYGRQAGPFFASNGDNALKSNLVLNQNNFNPLTPNYGYFTFGIRSNPLSASVSFTDVTCNGGNNGSITVSTSGGVAPYQYSVDNCGTFQAASTFTGLTAGTYNVCVQDALGCYTTVGSVVISEPTAIVLSPVIINESCAGASDGSIDLSGTSGSTPPYQYSIDNCATLQASGLFSGLTAGSYTACVTDANGCTASTAVTVASDAPSCCFAAISPLYQHFDTDLNGGSFTVPAGQLIVFPSKVYVASTITVQTGATLDITNSDVVFAAGAGIIFQGAATLAAHNSTFRPCNTTDTWAGISFTGVSTGVLNENVLICAVAGLTIVSDGEVEVSNNEFQNCSIGVSIAGNTVPAVSHSVTGNTIVVNNQNNFPPITFNGIVVSNITVTGGISHNDINYSIISSNTTGDDFVGVNVQNGSALVSGNQFHNIRQAYTLIGGSGSNSFDDNTVAYNQTAMAIYDPGSLPLVAITVDGATGPVLIKNNTLTNTRTQNTPSQIGVWVVNSLLVITDNNEISDFSAGVYYNTSRGQISHNKIENSDASGILVEDCPTMITVRGNNINNNYTDIANVGIIYRVNSGTGLTGVNILNNCVFNTRVAIACTDLTGNCLPIPEIRENYLYDYTSVGLQLVDFTGTVAPGGGRNTFLSNNTGAFDVSRTVISCTGPPVFLTGNSGGLSITPGTVVVIPPPPGFTFDQGCNSRMRIGISGDEILTEYAEANYPVAYVNDHYELQNGYSSMVASATNPFDFAASMLGILLTNPTTTEAIQFVNALSVEQVLDATQIAWLNYRIATYEGNIINATAVLNSIAPVDNDQQELQQIEAINVSLAQSGRTLRDLNASEIALLTSIDNNRGLNAATARNMLHVATGNNPYIYDDLNITLPVAEDDGTPAVNENEMIVYPNPASDNLSIAFCYDQYTSVTFNITDMEGRIVREVSVPYISGKLDIDISNITAGMYMLNVYGDGEQVMNTRFVKADD